MMLTINNSSDSRSLNKLITNDLINVPDVPAKAIRFKYDENRSENQLQCLPNLKINSNIKNNKEEFSLSFQFFIGIALYFRSALSIH